MTAGVPASAIGVPYADHPKRNRHPGENVSRIPVTAQSMNATERLPGEAEMQPHVTPDGRSDRTVDVSESMLGDLHDAISYMLPSAGMSSSE